MRRILLILALGGSVLALAPSAGAETLFVLSGRGWGHGVGMSQWGAFGLAEKGRSYKAILRHYYTDTAVQERAGRNVRVELASGSTSLVVGSAGAFRVAAGTRKATHKAGDATVTKTSRGRIRVAGLSGTFKSPATFKPKEAPLRLGSTTYRGKLVVSVSGGRLRAVNRLGMDAYIQGVVPRESPSWWPPAALQAQAVAARSYALFALVRGGGKCGGAFCPDTRDQVYGGLSGEAGSTNAAVKATAREVVVDRGGNVAQTFFHSSSGGRTADSRDIWGGDVSYLKSVSDPTDGVRENPNRRWRVVRTPGQLRSGLGLPCTPSDAALARDSSDRVGGIRACGITADGGDSLRWELELKSNRFWLGVLRLNRSHGRIEWGRRVTLSALARGVKGSVLKRKPSGAGWDVMQPVNGAESVSKRPRVTTSYRLGPRAFGVSARVKVEPRLRITTVGGTSLSGTMRPRRTGTTISIQRLSNGTWRPVATTTLNADGAWKAKFPVDPGRYRAFAAPGQGLVAGTSPAVRVAA
jgi:stage II sporulation protein D